MSAIFILEKKSRKKKKKKKTFYFLKGRYFVMDGPIYMNASVFSETFVGFLKSVVLQTIPRRSQRYVNLHVRR